MTLNLGDVWWIDPTPHLTGVDEIRVGTRLARPKNIYVDWGTTQSLHTVEPIDRKAAMLYLALIRRAQDAIYKKWSLGHKDRKLNHEDDDRGPFLDHGSRSTPFLDHGSRARKLPTKIPSKIVFLGWIRGMTTFDLYGMFWIDPTPTLLDRLRPRILLWDSEKTEHVEPVPGSLWAERRTRGDRDREWWQKPNGQNAEDIDMAMHYLREMRAQEDRWYKTEAGSDGKLYHKPGQPCSDPTELTRREVERGVYDILPRPAYARKFAKEGEAW